MFRFFKKELDDKWYVKEFVRHIFVQGRETYVSISEAMQMISPHDVKIPMTEDRRLEVSVAILGASLATLKGFSSFMSRDRGIRIENLCVIFLLFWVVKHTPPSTKQCK